MLFDGEQVGQNLARVIVIAQRVDDRHGGVGCHFFEASVGIGAPDNRGNLTLKHPSGVGNRLFFAQLTAL